MRFPGVGRRLCRALVIASSLAATSLGGCALGSGVASVGPGLYGITEMRAPVRGGGAEAHRAVLAEAAAFCGRSGRYPVALGLRPGGDPRMADWPTAFSLVFGCG